MLYKVGVFFCKIYLFFRVRLHVEGLENIPKEQGFILASNHRHNLDAVLLGCTLGRDIRFMAKAELFQGSMSRWLFRQLNCIAVDRGKGDMDAMEEASRIISTGGVLGMFPEGHRSASGTLLRPKSGTAMLALKTQAPILPAAICFYGEKPTFRKEITVRYGPLMTFDELGFTEEHSPGEIKRASKKLMEQIGKLLGAYLPSEEKS